ncbi:hypothetical protein ACFE04_001938 [Oxalis oulophora]
MTNSFARRIMIPRTSYDRKYVKEECDMEFEFLEDGGDRLQQQHRCSIDEEEEEENVCSSNSVVEEKRVFWENQNELLQATLYRTSSLESRIRVVTKDALKEIGNICGCGKSGCCKTCLMRKVCDKLGDSGYNSAICKSKWRTNPFIPSGEHTFLDVVENSKRGDIRVIIELNFRAEFELAKANEEYNRLVARLPEVFVGKVERLQNVIKIVCSAAKKCMKEKKMHLGPWRKQRYMQAKWLGNNYERTKATPAVISWSTIGYPNGLPKPTASILSVDLIDRLPSMHCTAVQVV